MQVKYDRTLLSKVRQYLTAISTLLSGGKGMVMVPTLTLSVYRCFAVNYMIKVFWSYGYIISTWTRWKNKRGKRQCDLSLFIKFHVARATTVSFSEIEFPL